MRILIVEDETAAYENLADISAMGTVGISTGITRELEVFSRD